MEGQCALLNILFRKELGVPLFGHVQKCALIWACAVNKKNTVYL